MNGEHTLILRISISGNVFSIVFGSSQTIWSYVFNKKTESEEC